MPVGKALPLINRWPSGAVGSYPQHVIINVVDIEATCWEKRPPAGHVSDIIEIGLTVTDLAAGERLAKHKILVRPERSTVSEFCTKLTGLTQAEVDRGMSFAEACQVLVTEHDATTRPWASWGNYDRSQFLRQCEATGVSYPFGDVHVNAKTVFSSAYRENRAGRGMAAALEAVGLPLEGRHHDGADDSWNIAALILHMSNAGNWPLAA
jgi:inhibitor of KinA sporulation pathway (predicted exonuclease)